MPAAAVIPAPIAYINVVAVKKLVVEVWMIVLLMFRQRWNESSHSSVHEWVLSYL